MKKTYEKPVLVKRQRLSHVTAQELPSIEPQ
ncbi:putative RiPP precursor [Mesorhizobium caraganae]|nr:putative RiPP precursor [Mesorhizobium caraganae]MBM2711649.1 putative RiPP precursor [Mesorhizobium caraganae]